MIFSCIIPASEKDIKSQKLTDLIDSIRDQDFPQDQIEILVETDGDSEQAKANGIRRATGQICAMFCADNYIVSKMLFNTVYHHFVSGYKIDGIYTKYYAYKKDDNSLNRYFSLIGNNDPIPFYLGKSDRRPYYEMEPGETYTVFDFSEEYANRDIPSLGDNGFFIKRETILKADLDHYYPMDCFKDLVNQGHKWFMRFSDRYVWHRTSDNLISFLIKRYKYARDLYSDRMDRRWRMLDTKHDYFRLGCFILATASVIPCLATSIRGFLKIRDFAWFWHWPVCFGFLITYSLLAIRNLFKHGRLFQCVQLQPA